MTDEKYTFIQDCKDKKSTAASAFRARTHCGKSGQVRLPSDFMTRKELNAMNGECKSYRMRDPMTWAEFKELPDDLKAEYVQWVREEFKVPDNAFAELFNTAPGTVYKWFRTLGFGRGKDSSSSHKMWMYSDDRTRFLAWMNADKGEKKEEPAVEEKTEETPVDIPVEEPAVKEEPEIINEPMLTDDLFKKYVAHAVEAAEEFKRRAMKNEEPNIPSPTIFTGYPSIPVSPQSGSLTFEHNFVHDALETIQSLLVNRRAKIHISWEYDNEGETESAR